MYTKLEELSKVLEPILAYCDEFDQNFYKRMEAATGKEFDELIADRDIVNAIRINANGVLSDLDNLQKRGY